jgi:hypothetical protein
MKYCLIIGIFLVFVLPGCTKESEQSFLDGPWVSNSKGLVTIYSRPLGYSTSPSPELAAIQQTLDNQNYFVEIICQKLSVNYDAKVAIFFYNLDESTSKIGTKGGGSSNAKRQEIYYTFYLNQYYPKIQLYDYVGVHEMVHIVSVSALGLPGTLMMAEGYAVAIDGTLGCIDSSGIRRKGIEEWMSEFRNNNQLISPSILLMDFERLPAEQAYAQAGFFVDWLFKKYGVYKINLLFTSSEDRFKADFFELTGIPFSAMESEYMHDQITHY